jgi:hypothetical protein
MGVGGSYLGARRVGLRVARGGGGSLVARVGVEVLRLSSSDRLGMTGLGAGWAPRLVRAGHCGWREAALRRRGIMTYSTIDRDCIADVERVIRPHIRRTPVIEVEGGDFGLDRGDIALKLELLQHGGSFKARGAFANLLTREVPKAGVVAASGGNHGVAVAFAAMKLGVPAKIFVPSVASKEKTDCIRACGAELVIAGDRYAEALAASEEWVKESGAMVVHAYDQVETLLGQGTVGLELEEQAPELDTLAGRRGWRRANRWSCRVVRRANQDRGSGAGGRADSGKCDACGTSRGQRGGRDRGGFAGAEARGRIDVPHCAEICEPRRVGVGRGHSGGAGGVVENRAGCGGTWRSGCSCGAIVAELRSGGRRARWGAGVRGKHDRGGFHAFRARVRLAWLGVY